MGIIGKIIYAPISSKEKVEKYQQVIRDEEWKLLRDKITPKSKFLDVGCGAGYSMQKAEQELGCECKGIDPNPGAHGVGRYIKEMVESKSIVQGFAEKLPFENESFDVVYSSHVLEHVNDEQESLKEMSRVLKDDGVLIIGMPTATMTAIGFISNIFLTTHIRIYEALRNIFSKDFFKFFKKIFYYRSHSYPRANTILYDFKHYRVKNWERIVSEQFEVIEILQPCLYPYPDYIQWFKLHKSRLGSSSVFFVCKKIK